MNCLHCGKSNPGGQRFCDGCGARFERVCPACKAPVAPDARFCGACGAALTDAAPTAFGGPDARVPEAPDGERRHLTVMFADLVGSTALSGRLDPEALREVLRDFQKICVDAVTRYGGTISQYLGDGVLAYFGYPAAHDNDAERAVLAGLAVVAEVRRLAIETRVGIHSGLVVVGAVGTGSGAAELAIGETPNLAARVQGEAAPNSVCVSGATLSLVAGRFEVSSLGARALKGIDKPVDLYEVVAAAKPDRERPAARFASPIVGRAKELRHLLDRYEAVKSGEGQAVFLSGQGGIGKSRLLAEFREQAKVPAAGWRSLHCSPFDQNSALRPVIDLIERMLRARAPGLADDPAAALHLLLDTAGAGDATNHVLIGGLLGIAVDPGAGGGSVADLAPAQKRLRTLDALVAWLQADSQQAPLVMVVEDLHWIDASTRDLLGSILERIASLPILLIATFRPEFVPPWPVNERIGHLALSRLGAEQVLSISRGITGLPLSARLVDEIVRRTDGVPLFVEELTKAILGSGSVVERDGELQWAGAATAALDVPATLRDSLTAQLDRLGAAKAVAQLASVLGREFDYALLHAVSDASETELDLQLAALNRANIIQQTGVPPRSHYVFKHALIQEAAYDTLLKSARQRHHRRVAEAYVQRLPEVVQARPELVAHHYSRASMPEAAVPLWQQAGELAVARSGYEEAIAHFNAALEQIAQAVPSDAMSAAELGLRVKVGPALMARLGMGSPETGANYSRACELAETAGEPAERFAAMWGDWLVKNTKGQLAAATARSEDLVALGRRLPDDGFELQAHHSRWTNSIFLGDMAAAREDTLAGIGLYDRFRHRHHKHLYGGHDPGVCACNFGSVAAWATGQSDEARSLTTNAVALARDLNHSFSMASAFMFASFTLHSLGDSAAAGPLAEALVGLCAEHGFVQWLGIGQVGHGLSLVKAGKTEAGIRLVDAGITAHIARGPGGFSVPLISQAVAAHLAVGDKAAAIDLLARAVALSDKSGMAWNRSEILRVQAITRFEAGEIGAEEAAAGLDRASACARSQGAPTLELRVQTALAALHAARGETDLARTMLTTVRDSAGALGSTLEYLEAERLLGSL